MRPNFSEFSYGYALTEALVGGRQHLVRPNFPTQVEEGKSGYDLQLDCPGYPLFLQFKVCDGMKTRGAKELSKFQLPLRLPFLRMNLMPAGRSKQHSLLSKLESQGETVFYAAPRFYEDNEFASHYRKREIICHTAFVSPSAIGPLPNDKEHHVAFECMARQGWFLSDPREVAPILDGYEFKELNQRHLDKNPLMTKRISKALANVCNVIIEDLQDNQGSFDDPTRIRNLLIYLRGGYSDLPDTEDLMDSFGQTHQDSLISSKNELGTLLADILQAIQQTSEKGVHMPENVNLLTGLTQLYFEATLILMSD